MKAYCIYSAALAAILAFSANTAMAVTLPDGTCSGSGMTVTVKGGKIVAYSYQGRSFPVKPIGAASYKIGSAGSLSVRNPKGKSFSGNFSMRGIDSPAIFECR